MKLFLSMLLFSQLSFAQTLFDRFELRGEQMPAGGFFAGQEVENQERRSIVLLTQAEKEQLGVDTSSVVFANLMHNNEFYIAELQGLLVDGDNNLIADESPVEEVVFSLKHWAAKIRPELKNIEAHAELHFKLKTGYKLRLLYNQSQSLGLEQPLELDKLVLTVEAVRSREALDAGLFPYALGPHYAISHRIVSNEQIEILHARDPESEFTNYPLNFSQTKVNASVGTTSSELLIETLRRSDRKRRSEAYHFLKNNCINNVFILLDSVMSYNQDTTGDINIDAIDRDILDFINNDVDKVMSALISQVNQHRDLVDADTADQIINYAEHFTMTQLDDLKVSSDAPEQNFLFQLAAFVDGHLRARGLIQ